MSWRWEILTDQWMTNGLRFATKEEAEASVFDLTKGFYETRVTETDDPVNYGWVDGKAVPLNPNCESCGVELESDPPQDDEFTCWCHQCNVKRQRNLRHSSRWLCKCTYPLDLKDPRKESHNWFSEMQTGGPFWSIQAK